MKIKDRVIVTLRDKSVFRSPSWVKSLLRQLKMIEFSIYIHSVSRSSDGSYFPEIKIQEMSVYLEKRLLVTVPCKLHVFIGNFMKRGEIFGFTCNGNDGR